MGGSFFYLIVLVAIFYFFLIRPQQKQQQKRRELLESLQAGDEITTIGGIYGRITLLGEDFMMLDVGGQEIKFQRTAAANIVRPEEPAEEEDEEEEGPAEIPEVSTTED